MLRRWFGALIGGKAQPLAAPTPDAVHAPEPLPPRAWHDEIAHAALPYLLLTEAEEVLAGEAPAQGRLDLLYDLFEDIGRRRGLGFDEAMDAADQAKFLRRSVGDARVAAIVMPPPVFAGEAYFVGLGAAAGVPPRCLALDRAAEGTVLVALDADGARDPVGAGPAPELDAFLAALVAR